MRKKQILANPSRGNGKTYYFMKKSDITYAKNINYLCSLEEKSIKALSSVTKEFFLLTKDVPDNKKSFDEIFNILTNYSKNKMKAVSEIQKLLQKERISRKRAELELKEIKNKKKNA